MTTLTRISKSIGLATSLTLAATSSFAADLEITIQNLTAGIYFTPLAVVAHTPDASLFEIGEIATPELQEMAEGGSLAGLAGIANSINANVVANPAEGLLAPTAMTTATLTNDTSNSVLSIVAMVLPSNDGFAGLNAWNLGNLIEAGMSWSTTLSTLDAGTEVNSEAAGTIPGPADGGEGYNPTRSGRGIVYFHPGVVTSDDGLDQSVLLAEHKFDNPSVQVTVTRIQ